MSHAFHVILGLSLAVTVQSVGGAKEPGPIEAAEVKLDRPVDFERDIRPILRSNCIACHNKSVNQSDLLLETVKSIREGGSSGPAILPGDADKSLLLLLASRHVEPLMPPIPNEVNARPLTPNELGLLRQWLIEGARSSAAPSRNIIKWRSLPSRLVAVHSIPLSPWSRFSRPDDPIRLSCTTWRAMVPPSL